MNSVTHHDHIDSHCAFDWFCAGEVREHGFRKFSDLIRNRINAECSLGKEKKVNKRYNDKSFWAFYQKEMKTMN